MRRVSLLVVILLAGCGSGEDPAKTTDPAPGAWNPLGIRIVHLKSGDKLKGETSERGDEYQIDGELGKVVIEKSKVERLEIPEGLSKRVYLKNGDVLIGSLVEEGESYRIGTDYGEIRVTRSDVDRIEELP